MKQNSQIPTAATITGVELFEVRVPLSELARGAMSASDNGLGMAIPTEEPWLEADFLFCRLIDEAGAEGWGEAYVWLPESGVSNRDMASAIEHHLGSHDPEADRDVVAAVRERCGTDLRLRVDYNQAYSAPQAVRALRMLEPLGIDAAEQPLPLGDLVGMVEVAKRTSIPVFLHEGFFALGDLVALIDAGGCGVVGINGERPGGLTGALRAIDYAAARGMGTIIHNQPLGIGTAMHAHLAAARFDRLGHDVELAGDVMFDHHLVHERYQVEEGSLVLPGGPGWGITVDRDALDDHLVAPPVVLSA